MSGFVVDSRTLVAVRDTLGRLHDQLVGMHTVIWHQHGTLGGAALESELEQFCATWHYGVAELGGQLQDLTRRLGEAAAAYDRIEQRITHAGAGSGAGGTGSASHPAAGHSKPTHHPAAKHHAAAPHHAPAKHHSAPKHHAGAGGPHYSGGAGLAPASGGTRHEGEPKHSGEKHSGEHRHPGVGSGTTVIPPLPHHHSGGSHHSGSGSGVTVIGGGPARGGGAGHGDGKSGSGTTTIDEKIHRAENRQRAELAAALKLAHE